MVYLIIKKTDGEQGQTRKKFSLTKYQTKKKKKEKIKKKEKRKILSEEGGADVPKDTNGVAIWLNVPCGSGEGRGGVRSAVVVRGGRRILSAQEGKTGTTQDCLLAGD